MYMYMYKVMMDVLSCGLFRFSSIDEAVCGQEHVYCCMYCVRIAGVGSFLLLRFIHAIMFYILCL